jgi:WD40 repeat protein
MRVWDAATGEEVHTLAGHTDAVTSVAYNPDGTRIVSGSTDQTVRQWYVDVDYLLKLADSLIQRDPPIFVGQERALFGFDDWPAREH